MKIELCRAEQEDRPGIDKLAREHPYPEYAGYRRHELDFASDLYAHQVASFLDAQRTLTVVARRDGELAGFACAAPLDWETSHFGVPMGSIPFLVASGPEADRREIAAALLEHVSQLMRERGSAHLSIRLDAQEMTVIGAAQEHGFRIMDTIVTHLGISSPPRPEWVAERFPELDWEVRSGPQLSATDPAEVAHFAEFMRQGYRNDRFHADPRLPDERCDELYVEWFRRIFEGEWATGVQLVRRHGRLVGFCSFQEASEVRERYGSGIIGRGLAAVLPEGRGAYALLVENICTRCPVESRFQEFDTQIQNLPVINVWIRRGMSLFRTRHSLHRWLDE